ncbi:hypothetical protein BDQ17DRAFT_1334035 [Cyathus striatus]|nr:hypothetical protein BDQ17DRAFT_1334035 [Cyathus striatus]
MCLLLLPMLLLSLFPLLPLLLQNGQFKATGAGSRSGQSNRRGGGTSDTEVMKLSKKQQQAAALKVPMLRLKGVQKEVESGSHVVDEDGRGLSAAQKLKVVAYVTLPEHWPSFKLNQHRVWMKALQIVDTILPGITVDVIRNYWTLQALPKYKADSKIFELIDSIAHDDADIIFIAITLDAVEAMKQKARNLECEEEERQESESSWLDS